MKDTCDIEMINTSLKNLKYDFMVKPDGNGTEFIWLCATDNSYAFKVPTSFVLEFEETLKNNDDPEDDLRALFGFNFLYLIKDIPSFYLHQRLGFCVKDYAEYSIEYEPIKLEKLIDAEFTIGDIKVKVSHCSSLFHLLIKQCDLEDVETMYDASDLYGKFKLEKLGTFDKICAFHSYTIKLKGISPYASSPIEFFESLQDDLYSVLYYLSVLYPTEYNELPKISNSLNEIEVDEEPYVNLNRDMNVSIKSGQYTELCVKSESGILNWQTVLHTSHQEDTNDSYREEYRSLDRKSRNI